MPESYNDLTTLDHSYLFADLVGGIPHSCDYVINGFAYHLGYYLSDRKYSKYATFIQSTSEPDGGALFFNKKDKGQRKEI